MSWIRRFNAHSLAKQFLLAGGLVSILAMLLVGAFVTKMIEDAVTRNSAAATALYVDSVIAPLLPDMQTTDSIDDTVSRALDETLGQGTLGQRLVSFRLWREDGTILYSNEKDLVGKWFELNPDLRKAFAGTMIANVEDAADAESERERQSQKPLLEIYNPVLQPWSGKVVAVSEFYEVADGFQRSLQQARLKSWLAVASFTLAFFFILSAIVFRGSRTIEDQRGALADRIRELSALLEQNERLRTKVVKASQRTTAFNESYLRRIGADLHDGPAQLVAYASLRLDSDVLVDRSITLQVREREISAIRTSLDEAIREIGVISSGLVLPQIGTAHLSEILERAVRAHEQRTGTKVALSNPDRTPKLTPSGKICVYRFVQETLNNAYRHGGGIGQRVKASSDGRHITIEVSDRGDGFDVRNLRPTSLGLAGLKDRIESLGGSFEVETCVKGTTVKMSLRGAALEKA